MSHNLSGVVRTYVLLIGLANAARNGEIPPGECALLAQYLVPCGCPPLLNDDGVLPLPVPVDAKEVVGNQTSVLNSKIDAQTEEFDLAIRSLSAKTENQTDEFDEALGNLEKKIERLSRLAFEELYDEKSSKGKVMKVRG